MQFLLVTAFSLLCAPCIARDCGLSISMLDSDGKSYPYRVQSFKSPDGAEHADQFRGLRARVLPCGSYAYELLRSDTTEEIASHFGRESGTVEVEDSRQVLTLWVSKNMVITSTAAFAADVAMPLAFTLRGVLIGLPQGEQASVRLLAVSSSEAREVEPDADGKFEFYHPNPGDYVVLVLQPGRLLAAQHLVISLRSSPSVEINIAAPAP